MTFVLQTGSFEGMKTLNQSTVLNIIRLKEPISRAEIAKFTKLTPPTVSSLVNELVEKNLVKEEESVSSKAGGRRPIMLRINYSAYYIIGVYAAAEVMRTVLTTMDGKIVFDYVQKMMTLPSKAVFIDMLKESIHYVLDESKVDQSAILGIGFAMHGLVDPDQGVAIYSPHLHLGNIPIKEIIEEEFKLPVMVENDVRALAIGESWFGQGKGTADFVCLSVGKGVGSGIVINNEVYRSPFNTAGEIGHTVVNMDGPLCECGNEGCLEAYASEKAILKKMKEESKVQPDSLLHGLTEDQLSIRTLFQAANDSDDLAVSILNESGKYLGIAAANMVNILKPSKIILEGRIFEEGPYMVDAVKEMVEKYTFKSSPENITIVCSDLGKKGMVLGAVTLILKKIFKIGRLESV